MEPNTTHQVLLSDDGVNKYHVAGYMNKYRENSIYVSSPLYRTANKIMIDNK